MKRSSQRKVLGNIIIHNFVSHKIKEFPVFRRFLVGNNFKVAKKTEVIMKNYIMILECKKNCIKPLR